MSKNLMRYSELVSMTKEQALARFAELYHIAAHELPDCAAGTPYDRAFECACLLLQKTLDLKLGKHVALAQVTDLNVAALATHYDNPQVNAMEIRRAVGEVHGPQRTMSNMTRFRKSAAEHVLGRAFTLNVEHPEKNPGVEFSWHDEVSGFRCAPLLDHEQFYLLGCYAADGKAISSSRWRLTGTSEDGPHYQSIEELVRRQFNLQVKATIKPRSRAENGNRSSWIDVCLNIDSKGHMGYLKDHVKLIDDEGTLQQLDIARLGIDHRQTARYHLSYLMGMGAGGITATKSASERYFSCSDGEGTFISEMERAAAAAGMPLEYRVTSRKPLRIRFDAEQVVRMALAEAPRVNGMQVGLFTNPKHVNYLIERYRDELPQDLFNRATLLHP